MKHLKFFKKTPKGKDPFIFVRFGGLDVKPQKGYGASGYHTPPNTKGFYAMPKIAQESFLIGSIDKYQPDTVSKNPDKSVRDSLRLIRKEFRKDDGYIWHHLGNFCKPHQVISTNGSWVKTSVQDWAKAFSKCSLNDRYGHGDFSIKSISQSPGISGYYSKDHLEVFFDEKV